MSTKSFVQALAALLITLPLNLLSADIQNIKFDHITADDGLSQNTVEKIFQDSKGYIWIGTRDGLNKYDGLKFKIFRNERGDTNSLASNWVRAIEEDAEGKIWIGTDGLNVFDPKTEELTRISASEGENSFKGGTVFDIQIDADNSMWLATNNGLVHYNPDDNSYTTYYSGEGEYDFKGYTVFSILITSRNQLFIATDDDAIFEYDRKNDRFILHEYKKDFFGANFRKSFEEDLNGLIFIGADGGGIHIYNPENQQTEVLPIGENGLNAVAVKTKILPLASNQVLIGTDGGGINIYNPQTKQIEYLLNDTKNPKSLHGNAVFELFEDTHGNIWVGHFGAGISLWRKNKEKFNSFFHNPYDPNSLSNGVVTAIFQDSMGRIWIGHDGGGLCLFQEEDKSFKRIRRQEGEEGTLTTDIIIAIDEDENGNLLLGSYSGGLMVFDPIREKVIEAFGNYNGLSTPHIWDVMPDSEGRFWLAELGLGFTIFDPGTKSFENFIINQDDNVCSNVILSFNQSSDGNVWVASENAGICVLSSEGELLNRYSYEENNNNSLSSNDVKGIAFQDNYVWIATNGGGLNRLNLQDNSFNFYTTDNGLSSNAIMGILQDKNENLWLSSTLGLMKFNTITEEVETFDISQGIQGNEFKYNSQFLLSDGRMIFGGTNGITIFHPDSIKPSPIQPNLVFTDLLVFNKKVDLTSKNAPIDQHINELEAITIKHKQRVFTIEFISLDYTNPEKNQYRYILDGLDEEWTEAGNRNYVSYSNIPPGKYLLKVQCTNSDGVWADIERQLSVRIRPPWYRSGLFIFLLLVLIGYVVYKAVKTRTEKAKLEKETLQKKINEGQAVIDSKLKEIEQQQDEIKRRDEQEREVRYQTDGLAKFSKIISKNRNNLTQLLQSVTSELVGFLGANMGAIYLSESNSNNDTVLKLSSSYCLATDVEAQEEIMIGEGYIGTCYKKMETIEVTDLPQGYFVLSSGLGDENLKYAIFEPIIDDQTPLGVIEVSAIAELPVYKKQFLSSVSQTIASVFAVSKAQEDAEKLLEENKQQTEEIRAHEEELRQNLEELTASQEMSTRREQELLDEIKELKKRINLD